MFHEASAVSLAPAQKLWQCEKSTYCPKVPWIKTQILEKEPYYQLFIFVKLKQSYLNEWSA